MQKTALITGSSRGIGSAIALRLAKDGFRIILHAARNADKAQAVRQKILELGGSAEIILADLRDLSQTQAMLAQLGKLDVLVLNASIQYRTPWLQIDRNACQEQLNCNFVSSMLLIQHAASHMQQARWGRIITIGSVQEAKPHPDMLVYAASKAAQTNMMQSLSLQLAPYGITVNNVAPGVIETDRNIQALADPVYAETVRRSIPVGFFGQPEDCAGLVSLLCSDQGRYITGQSIYVDGGKSVQ